MRSQYYRLRIDRNAHVGWVQRHTTGAIHEVLQFSRHHGFMHSCIVAGEDPEETPLISLGVYEYTRLTALEVLALADSGRRIHRLDWLKVYQTAEWYGQTTPVSQTDTNNKE